MEPSKSKSGRPRTRVALPEVEYTDVDYQIRDADIGPAPHALLSVRISFQVIDELDRIAAEKNEGVARYQSDPRRMSRNRLICRAINALIAAENAKGAL